MYNGARRTTQQSTCSKKLACLYLDILSCYFFLPATHTEYLIYRHEIARVPGNFRPDEVVSLSPGSSAIFRSYGHKQARAFMYPPTVNLTIPLQIIVIIFYESTPQYYINILCTQTTHDIGYLHVT